MRLFLSTSSLPHSVAVTRNKTSKYLAKSRNAKTLDYHQVRYFFACERFIFYDLHKVTGLIRVSGPGRARYAIKENFLVIVIVC